MRSLRRAHLAGIYHAGDILMAAGLECKPPSSIAVLDVILLARPLSTPGPGYMLERASASSPSGGGRMSSRRGMWVAWENGG
jgi:hypothetical protein